MPWLATPPTKIGNRKKCGIMRGTYWTIFFKNFIKNPYLFFKGDELWNRKNKTIARHAFPARGLKNGRTTRFVKKKKKKKRKKNSKITRDFRDISKISGTIIHRPDTYLEKNHCDFRTVIFGAKKLSTKNRVFFIFAKNSYFKKKGLSFEREKWVKWE